MPGMQAGTGAIKDSKPCGRRPVVDPDQTGKAGQTAAALLCAAATQQPISI